jgi:hypothetical protein
VTPAVPKPPAGIKIGTHLAQGRLPSPVFVLGHACSVWLCVLVVSDFGRRASAAWARFSFELPVCCLSPPNQQQSTSSNSGHSHRDRAILQPSQTVPAAAYGRRFPGAGAPISARASSPAPPWELRLDPPLPPPAAAPAGSACIWGEWWDDAEERPARWRPRLKAPGPSGQWW